VKGFFKTRGYYNLDRIPPEKYREASAFTSSSNYRAWLLATDLFQSGPDGREEVLLAGKALLDSALTDNGDSVFESPIVVEGTVRQESLGPTSALSQPRYPRAAIPSTSFSARLEQPRNCPDEECAAELRRADYLGWNLHCCPEKKVKVATGIGVRPQRASDSSGPWQKPGSLSVSAKGAVSR
jgi:hypothetical protein